MKKNLKMIGFVPIYIILPLLLNVCILKVISGIGWIDSMRETTPMSIFLFLDTIAIIALILFVKYIRKEKTITFASIRKISVSQVLICGFIGLVLAMFTSSILKIEAFKESVSPIAGSIDWIIGGNLVIVTLVTLLNNFYKELCFRGLAFNEMKRVIPIAAALIIQASFYALELVYFKNPIPVILYAFLGQLIFGIIYYFGGSVWSSWTAQVCCSMGLVLFRRTDVSKIFTSGSSVILFASSIILLTFMLVVLYRSNKSQREIANARFVSVKQEV